jgi:hypothetical protein
VPYQTITPAIGIGFESSCSWHHSVTFSAPKRWLLPGILRILCLSIVSSLGLGKAVGDDLEYAIKAAYLIKFADFVSWPPGTLSDNQFVICVVGRDPFGALLERASEGQTIHHRPIVLRHEDTVSHHMACDLAIWCT